MIKVVQKIIQIAFLALFIFLFVKGKVQLWMGFFLLGIIASFIFSRFYCGWICSINTALTGVTWIKQKLQIKNMKIPKLFLKSQVRYLAFSLFMAVFIYTITTGKNLPVLPALFVISILVTFLYPEELWHRYLCPYGTLLNLSSLKSKRSIQIQKELCNNCGTCKRICPAKAILKTEEKHKVQTPDCLVCMKCIDHCKQRAISYK